MASQNSQYFDGSTGLPMLLIACLRKPTGILTECTVTTNVSNALNLELVWESLLIADLSVTYVRSPFYCWMLTSFTCFQNFSSKRGQYCCLKPLNLYQLCHARLEADR